MKQRCADTGDVYYGGRGIAVCERWQKFQNFLEDMGEKPKGMVIDRIEVNGNYEPGNCRWATRRQSDLNTRRNVHLTLNGKTQTVNEWSKELGIDQSTISMRLKLGWNAEKALTTKVRENVWLTCFGKTQILRDWSREVGIAQNIISYRLRRGWSLVESLTISTGRNKAVA